MKLLFDQNISFRIVRKISQLYPKSMQIKNLGLVNYSDLKIWEFAKENEYTIVTFDSDFYDIANIKGHPPKIIWLRIGNTSTNNIAKVLSDKLNLIEDFIQNPDSKEIACLEID